MASGIGGEGGSGRQKWADNKVYSRKSFKTLKDMTLGKSKGNGITDNRVSISLVYKTNKERRELRNKLEAELILVRNFVNKLERCANNNNNNDMGKLKRVHSEVGDNVDKDKRTPKANPFYHTSDFILAKDKIPLSVSDHNNKSKGIGMSNTLSKVFKSCSLLLDKLMKHKHGWVFNNPVDVKALGLHDYFTIIKHPMDLGTVKSRLNTNWYKSPKEFAEDVRLTFHNAITYNPKGHDVHIMAEILSKLFEDKWTTIEADYARDLKASADFEPTLPTPTSTKPPPSVDITKTLERSESTTTLTAVKPKNPNSTPTGRTPVPKKPKAKDPHKRSMTYVEKQKLSNDLQNLPSEKLDTVVQIIRKRNPTLCQNDDEIEVDIDSVDIETLWELDRFVMNFKKNQSKIKKQVELAQVTEPSAEKNEAPSITEDLKEKKPEEKDNPLLPPAQPEKKVANASRSNSSRSSSSDSGSSSSGSDSDTSSN